MIEHVPMFIEKSKYFKASKQSIILKCIPVVVTHNYRYFTVAVKYFTLLIYE